MPRMNILNKSEQEKFNTPPIFTSFERKQFFTLPKPLKEIAETLRTPSTRIGFLLACGYFKASKRFFKPNDYHKNDIAFVINILNLRSECFIADYYLQGIRQYHQKVILEFYGYKKFDNQSIKIIKVEIASMMQAQLRPKLIFWPYIYAVSNINNSF